MLSLFSNIPIVLTLGGIGFSCFYYSDKINNHVNKKIWSCAKAYISVKEYFNLNNDTGYDADSEYYSDSDSDSDSDSESDSSGTKEKYFPYIRNKKEERQKLYYSDENNNNIVIELNDTNTHINDIYKKYNDVIFITKKINNIKYFKRIKEPSDDYIINLSDSRIFLQVEVIDNDNNYTISIHKYLENYMVLDNKLLDTKFLKWFIKYYTSKTLSENYIVKIFDKNINYVELTPNDYIIITDDKKELYKKISKLPPLQPPLIKELPPTPPPLKIKTIPVKSSSPTPPPPPPPRPFPSPPSTKENSSKNSSKKSSNVKQPNKIIVNNFTDDETDNNSSSN